MRILLFGDGLWAANSLLRLNREGWDLLGVIRRVKPKDLSLLEASQSLGLPVFNPPKVNSNDVLAQISKLNPDLVLSIAYDQILRRPLLDMAPRGFVNFHAGKLPFYRGRNIINWAIINGESEIGLTAHYIDEGIDTGDIISQRTLPIGWTDTYGDVLNRVRDAFPDLVAHTVNLIANGQVKPQPQSQPGTYFCKRKEGDEWIYWSDTSLNLYNKVRAIARPGPGARTNLNGKVVTIWRAFFEPSWPSYIAVPGQVVGSRQGEGVYVKTGDSTLLVQEVQAEGGEPRRPRWRIGTHLG